ncbi:uncharacterized protein LOC131596983 [Vicia villosa]|uniref:uncharacterized protein LOC131596983 n=1 Tax=Vicia villosa TaxID=3911 RepID=UPI00273B4CA2|nr:uncharacterized protein LOC131596983 [Vicia villosa]
MLRTIPVWVKLPHLPLHLWGAKSFSKIGSAIGTPLVTDECTAKKLRISYTRLLVEIDITQDLPKEININGYEGIVMKQAVEYEWKPAYCDLCNKIGHRCDQKTKQVKQWIQKKPEEKKEEQNREVVVQTPQTGETSKGAVVKTPQAQNEWRTVLRGARGKQTVSNEGVTCENDFGALEWGDDIVFSEKVP